MQKYYYILFFLISLNSCKQKEFLKENDMVSTYGFHNDSVINHIFFENNMFAGKKQASKKHINNEEKKLGDYAYFDDGKLSQFKIGFWNEYYENGTLKESGRYQIGRYIQCCFSGPCVRYYNYKIGKWDFYHLNGEIKAKVDFKLKKLWINTNCGGDYLKYGILSDEETFYNQQGEKIKSKIAETKIELEKSVTMTHHDLYLIPVIDNDTIIKVGAKY
jgi:hypothetical protein